MTVQGTLSEADLIAAARYSFWHRTLGLKLMFGVGCILLVAGIGSAAMGEIANGVAPALFGAFWVMFPLIGPKLTIRKQLKASRFLTEPGEYTFDDTQFSIARPSVQVSIAWSTVHSVVELKESFAIFSTKVCFHLVPKRFFDPDQVSVFRSLLQQVLRVNGNELVFRPRN